MNPFSTFRKPAWQASKADKRAAAVAGDDTPELRAALPALAMDDPDSQVRRQALQRCDNPALYARAMSTDADAGIRAWARQRWLAALTDGKLVPTDTDLDALSTSETEALAMTAGNKALRARVLARIQRAGFLADRALADPAPELRLALIERIDAVATLDRLAEQARKTDKHLARRARERSEALRLNAGDSQTHQRRAEAICERLEQLMRNPGSSGDRSQALDQAQADWQALTADLLPSAVQARFDGACAVVHAQLAAPSTPPPDVSAIAATEAKPTALPSPEELAAQARLQSELAANAERLAREQAVVEQRRHQDAEQRARHEAILQRLLDALDAGDLNQSRNLVSELDTAVLSPTGRQRWQNAQPRLKTLAGWEQWASNKVRARLCGEIEQLRGSGLHPDALATRVRELQQEWRRLDAAESRDAASAPSGLDKRFRALCAQAMKPAHGFFEKRDALRGQHRQLIETFFVRVADTMDSADGPGLHILQREASEHLRTLDQLAPGDRKALAKRLRNLLDTLRPRLEAGFQQAEHDRQQLIAAAERLGQDSDGRRAAAEAKSLMQRWQALSKGRPARDQQQWRQFRAALDAVFAGLDQRRQQLETDRAKQQNQAEVLVSELERLVGQTDADHHDNQAQIRQLREQWQTLAVRDRALAERFDTALTRQRDGQRERERDRRRQHFMAQIQAGPAPAESSGGDALALAQGLVFEIETLAGVETSESEREARRHWQLQRLQQHLRGGRQADPERALDDLLIRWRELTGLDAGDRQRYGERLSRAVERLIASS